MNKSKVLITGATGLIGGGAARSIAADGFEIHALVRSDNSAEYAERQGWITHRGDLRDEARLSEPARHADAIVHAANTGSEDAAEVDVLATRALLNGMSGKHKTFVYTSGVWVLGATGEKLADEMTPPTADAPVVGWRVGLGKEIQIANGSNVRRIVIRPGIVWSTNGGIPGMLARGDIPLVADGRQSWPMVDVEDLSDLYRRALQAPDGSILHGVAFHAKAEEVAMAAAGRNVDKLRRQPDLTAARKELGAFADALALDQRVSAEQTNRITGWNPTKKSLSMAAATLSY